MTSADCSHNLKGHILVLNGCEERLQLAIGKVEESGTTLLASQEWTVPGRSVGFIAPSIDSMLKGLELTPDNITGVACVRGPGSFTGLRLTIAAAAGFAAGNALPVAGLKLLPLIAAPLSPILTGTLYVTTYARRGQVYLQSFDNGQPIAPVAACRATEAAALIASSGPAHVCGSGVRKNPEVFEQLSQEGISILPPVHDTPTGHSMLEASAKALFSTKDIAPLYIRESDAEENLEIIATKRGMDPDQARKRLHRYE
ncbi:tRNA (adenosine(37)-N6)-threonylcarbamoyltransferase complex dimerization subunit type 1 TsaB [Desulfovibrio oxyclinae]|uniref:tRNA (adenosine(37)-N6)-threonylcarbamoyltransferase complex dimerization subunit type 1 TsaB n=1 Tax=Desulfovibrio oxyclinae TaxID=63560 RepID=UPI0003658E18|nr:tRNA (adenosine(37)-N6)-threonylcarbamoyltransferase complex dimerization subunit type 1 TsaB [Desulfovibrio oxyclinae]